MITITIGFPFRDKLKFSVADPNPDLSDLYVFGLLYPDPLVRGMGVADPNPGSSALYVLGLLYPYPLVRAMDPDPDPSIIKQKE